MKRKRKTQRSTVKSKARRLGRRLSTVTKRSGRRHRHLEARALKASDLWAKIARGNPRTKRNHPLSKTEKKSLRSILRKHRNPGTREARSYKKKTRKTKKNSNILRQRGGSKALATKILNWHGGQSSACYLVGSRWHSGLKCFAGEVRDCAWELEKSRMMVQDYVDNKRNGYTKRDLTSLQSIIKAVKSRITG